MKKMWPMKKFILIILLPVLMGCSQALTSPDAVVPIQYSVDRDASLNGWDWGSYTIRVSEDRMEVEIVPCRTYTLHLNVNPFVEGPLCPNCLTLGKPQPQGDGSAGLAPARVPVGFAGGPDLKRRAPGTDVA